MGSEGGRGPFNNLLTGWVVHSSRNNDVSACPFGAILYSTLVEYLSSFATQLSPLRAPEKSKDARQNIQEQKYAAWKILKDR